MTQSFNQWPLKLASFAIIISVIGLLSLIVATPAKSQECLPLEVLIKSAKDNFQEIPAWTGTIDGTETVVILLQSEKGSWGLAAVDGNQACIIATGMNGNSFVTGRRT